MSYYGPGQRFRNAFDKLDLDRDGYIALNELPRALDLVNIDDELSPQQQKRLIKTADVNKDGRLDFNEFLRFLTKPDYQATTYNKMLYRTVDVVTPNHKKDEVYSYVSQYSCLPPPLFIILISLAEIGVFIGYAIYDGTSNWWYACPGCYEKSGDVGVLVFDPRVRQEAWRFISYMLIHSGIEHIASNIVVQLVLGIPLELVHKFWRIGPLYLGGVVLGSLVQSGLDPYVLLVGASGGVYALLTAHVANLILNWSEMRARWIRLLGITLYVGVDVGFAVYRRFYGQCELISYAAHIGGALTGLLLGFVLLRNINPLKWEKVLWWVGLCLFVCVFIACVLLNIFWPVGQPGLFTVRCNTTE